MHIITSFISGTIAEIWEILLDASPFLLFGFLIAAIIKALMPDSIISKQLGGNGFSSVFKAALFGIPIPLCSCGVMPAAISLRNQGASRGATSSFLISTPETGVDSIAVTYALMDPLMTIFRPLAAFITALSAGVLENLFGLDSGKKKKEPIDAKVSETAGCCSGCECKSEIENKPGFGTRFKSSMDYAFTDMFKDLAPWLAVGFIIAGIIMFALPDNFFSEKFGSGIVPMLAMLLVGIPMYICATSSTPVAAALLLKGLSPGAALVFLLAGPATNAATITLVAKKMGARSLGIYLGTIAIASLGLGLLLDSIYSGLGITMIPRIADAGHILPYWLTFGSTVIFLALLLRGFLLILSHRSR